MLMMWPHVIVPARFLQQKPNKLPVEHKLTIRGKKHKIKQSGRHALPAVMSMHILS